MRGCFGFLTWSADEFCGRLPGETSSIFGAHWSTPFEPIRAEQSLRSSCLPIVTIDIARTMTIGLMSKPRGKRASPPGRMARIWPTPLMHLAVARDS